MPDSALDLTTLVFAKTEIGQQEIQSRALGLPPKVRSALILVDGRRTGRDLQALVGEEAVPALEQLMAQGCIRSTGTAEPAQAAAVPGQSEADAGFSVLPPPESRDAKAFEMARNFMMNTVNTIFGQNMRLTLIETIHACKTVQELRQAYPLWAEAMESNRAGAKRLPEMREKLFAVL